jgi:hypothetical protein
MFFYSSLKSFKPDKNIYNVKIPSIQTLRHINHPLYEKFIHSHSKLFIIIVYN